MSEDGRDPRPAGLARPVPTRPPLTSNVRSPLEPYNLPRPAVVAASAVCWALSALMGVAIIGYFVWRIDAVRDLLEAAVRAEDPDASDSTVRGAVRTTIGVTLVVLGLTVGLRALLAAYMAARRGWARVLLVVFALPTAVLPAVGASLLTDGTLDSRPWLLSVVIAQEVLMLAGVVTMFLPSANRWFRMRLRK